MALKSGQVVNLVHALDARIDVEVHIHAPLPEDYLPYVHARLILYKRIASARGSEELNDLREEIIDRFGVFGIPVDNLFRVTSLRLDAERFGIRRIDLGGRGGRIEFHSNTSIDPSSIIDLVQTDPDYRMDGGEKLRIVKELPDREARFEELAFLFERFRRRHAA